MDAVRRRLLVLSVVAAVAGCTGATPSSMSPPPSASASPSAVATPAASAPVASSVSGAAFAAALESATAELMAAIGNPDTAAPSAASKAFDAALESGEAAAISSTADEVLRHLSTGRAGIARVAGYQPGAALSQEWDAMFSGIAEGITAMRDGGLQGSKAAVDAGRARMGVVLQDHFWPAVRGPSPITMYAPGGRTMTASRQRWSTQVGNAFDGSPTSAWTAGDALPPQWIEIDLGFAATISGIRLLTFQDVPGATDHRVTVRSATGTERELARFTGSTRDSQWLEYTAPAPVPDVQVVRVTTLTTPAMIGWREVEVVLAPGSTPSACPAGSDNLTVGATATGEPSRPGREPALAIDGQASTAWDPGDTRGPGNVRGWITVTLARDALVSEVRVLLGTPAGGTTEYTIDGWPAMGGRSVALGKVGGTTKDGTWLSVAGPTPCVALRSFLMGVVSESPAAAVREIQVLGTLAP